MKSIIKELIRFLLYLLKRKPYKCKAYNGAEIATLPNPSGFEYFYGYYDRCPERNGKVLVHEMRQNRVAIKVYGINKKNERILGESQAYNWQMGSRALGIDDDTVSYNDFEDGQYVTKWFSLKEDKVVKTIPMPTMDIWKNEYILTTNFQRLRSVDPDYSYHCLPEMDEKTFLDYQHDGIWMYDIKKEEKKLILSIADILECKKDVLYTEGKHCVNHIMIAPDGKSFIFIHRYKYEGKKYDRLMWYDFKGLKCLHDDPLQSHFCWLDSRRVMGYCEYGGQKGWFETDTLTGKVKKLEMLTEKHPKNGHPTPWGVWIVVDGYPDLDRMQRLHAYNQKTKEYLLLAEFFHDLGHQNYNRCDLHPRFTPDGKTVYVDTLFSGSRQLCKVNVNLK